MNAKLITGLIYVASTIIGVASIASAAFAGTAVTNSYDTRVITNGVNKTVSNTVVTVQKVQNNESQSIKAESNFGDVNNSKVSFDGKNLTGYAESYNRRPVDPVAILTVVKQTETVRLDQVTNAQTFEHYNFSGTTNSHTVSSDSF